MGARCRHVVGDEAAAEARLQTAGEDDHAGGVALEQVEVDVGLAAPVTLEVARGRQLDEVAEPLVGGGEQRQVVALVAQRFAFDVVDEVRLETEDRLDPVLAARLVVLDGTVQHPVVGETERRLLERCCALRHLLDATGSVEQRVLGVDVEVRERRLRHGEPL